MLMRIVRYLATAALLAGIWYLLSGKTDLFHLGTGVLVAIVIASRYFRLQRKVPFPVLRFLLYVPWLLKQVIQSNLYVVKLVLSRDSKIAPRFIRKSITGMEDERAQTLLGCSITLTPGTLTVNIDGKSMLIHALDDRVADDIKKGIMARQVSRVFEDSPT